MLHTLWIALLTAWAASGLFFGLAAVWPRRRSDAVAQARAIVWAHEARERVA